MTEWNYARNDALGYDPSMVGGNSSMAVWWRGACGHKWDMSVGQRLRGQGCPYCSGRRVLAGFNDLATTHPDIAAQWDRESNELTPEQVSRGTHYNAAWVCPNGHRYLMPVNKKVSRNSECPVCSGKKIVAGINDFATIHPELAKEWHPTKNGDLKPSEISRESGIKVWWMGSCGHEWQATPHDRVESGTGCPICSARRSTSFPEQAIFYYIKKLYPDAMSRATGLFDSKIELDIYVPSIRFAVEFDGARWHDSEQSHINEQKKYELCKKKRITLVRVKEATGETWYDVSDASYIIPQKDGGKQLGPVIQAILNSIDPETNAWTRKKFKYQSDIDVNLERDANEIRSYLTRIDNSLAELRPDLVLDWNYEKNGDLRPEMFGVNSNDRVWWKCSACGHEWRTAIIHRGGKRHSGCPECSKEKRGKAFTKRIIAERGSLGSLRPDLAAEWHPTLNGELKPTDVALNNNKKCWWKCSKCGYDWPATPNNRANKGSGCPKCSGRVKG